MQGVFADSSSSSSASDDDPSTADVIEAAVQECVRKHEPPMIGGGDYAELAKVGPFHCHAPTESPLLCAVLSMDNFHSFALMLLT